LVHCTAIWCIELGASSTIVQLEAAEADHHMAAVDMGMGVAVTVADRLAVAVAVAVHRVAVVVVAAVVRQAGLQACRPFRCFPSAR
jgi:hypothetical protein